MTICERLFVELDKRGLTAYAMSKSIGVNTTTTTNWKQRGTDPPSKYIAPICKFLGCSLSYLLTGEETEQETKKTPAPELSVNERDMLKYFKQLTEREQAILIGEARAIVMFDEIASVPPGSASSDGKAG